MANSAFVNHLNSQSLAPQTKKPTCRFAERQDSGAKYLEVGLEHPPLSISTALITHRIKPYTPHLLLNTPDIFIIQLLPAF